MAIARVDKKEKEEYVTPVYLVTNALCTKYLCKIYLVLQLDKVLSQLLHKSLATFMHRKQLWQLVILSPPVYNLRWDLN